MGRVVFTGSVSAQASAGETVKISVTKPDGTTEVLTATTLADGSFSTSKDYAVAGNYSAVAHVDADATYMSVDSAKVTFTVTLQSRSISLNVSVA